MTMPETNPETFYIVDFDRTLADSDKLTDVFIEVAESHQAISREQVQKADADMKSIGDSLNTAGYVRDHLIEQGKAEVWDELEKQFIHESRSLNMLLPGAAELLEWLNVHNKRYGILTYGNPLWQHIKLTASGFNHVHHIILEQKDKGKFIKSWQQPDGLFRIPDAFGRGEASEIVLIDDKAVSFNGFPERSSRGYWVLDPAHELLAQQGEVPANVVRYTNLVELLKDF